MRSPTGKNLNNIQETGQDFSITVPCPPLSRGLAGLPFERAGKVLIFPETAQLSHFKQPQVRIGKRQKLFGMVDPFGGEHL